jgi:AAA domain-containing protein
MQSEFSREPFSLLTQEELRQISDDSFARRKRVSANTLAAYDVDMVSAADLQAMDFPDIKWIVPDYVCEGLTILAGKPKLGKSWLALDWALATACGGISCSTIECEPGDVLYCALEDNKRRLQRRLRQLLPNSNWPKRLDLLTSLRRLNEGGLDDIANWADVADHPRLIVIDTLACVRPTRGSRDNSYDSDYAALSPLQVFAGERNIGVVIVHHVRKMDSDDPLDTVSGTTGLTGAADSILVLNRDGQGATLYGRGRDIDEIETAMSFDKTTGNWTIMGPASEVRKSDERKAIVDALTREGIMSIGDLVAATGMDRNNVDQLVFKMAMKGELVRPKRGYVELP